MPNRRDDHPSRERDTSGPDVTLTSSPLPRAGELTIAQISSDFDNFSRYRNLSEQFVPAGFKANIAEMQLFLGRLTSYLEIKEIQFHRELDGAPAEKLAELKKGLHEFVNERLFGVWSDAVASLPTISPTVDATSRMVTTKVVEASGTYARDVLAVYFSRTAEGFDSVLSEEKHSNSYVGGTFHLRELLSGKVSIERDGETVITRVVPLDRKDSIIDAFNNYCFVREAERTQANPEYLSLLSEQQKLYAHLSAYFDERGIAVVQRDTTNQLSRTPLQTEIVNHPEFVHKELTRISLAMEKAIGALDPFDPRVSSVYRGATRETLGIYMNQSSFGRYSMLELAGMHGGVGIISVLLDPEDRKYNWALTRRPEEQETLLGDVINSFLANGNSYRAHRNRMDMLGVIYEVLVDTNRKTAGGTHLKIISLGCGNGEDLKRFATSLDENSNMSVDIVLQDISDEALNAAEYNIFTGNRAMVGSGDIKISKKRVNANILAVRRESPDRDADIMVSAGLFDYISKAPRRGMDVDAALLKGMSTAVKSDGYVVATRVGEDIEFGVMREFQGWWPIIQGDGIDMVRLATGAGYVWRRDLSDIRTSRELTVVRSSNGVTREFPDWNMDNVNDSIKTSMPQLKEGQAFIVPDPTRTNWFVIARGQPIKSDVIDHTSTLS